MNCIIIDDDESARLIINQLCKSNGLIVEDEFSSAIEAIKYLNETTVDTVFLDIHMPNFSGFDFIKTLKNPPNIILITSDKSFALEAFDFNCVIDYLLKPITNERFQKSLEKLSSIKPRQGVIKDEKKTQEQSNYIFVNVDKRLIRINIPDILLIEAKGDYISLKTEKDSYLVHSTLKNISKKLPTELFMKVHRSYIINFSKIIDIEDNSVLIQKHVVPVSRSHKSDLINKLNLL